MAVRTRGVGERATREFPAHSRRVPPGFRAWWPGEWRARPDREGRPRPTRPGETRQRRLGSGRRLQAEPTQASATPERPGRAEAGGAMRSRPGPSCPEAFSHAGMTCRAEVGGATRIPPGPRPAAPRASRPAQAVRRGIQPSPDDLPGHKPTGGTTCIPPGPGRPQRPSSRSTGRVPAMRDGLPRRGRQRLAHPTRPKLSAERSVKPG